MADIGQGTNIEVLAYEIDSREWFFATLGEVDGKTLSMSLATGLASSLLLAVAAVAGAALSFPAWSIVACTLLTIAVVASAARSASLAAREGDEVFASDANRELWRYVPREAPLLGNRQAVELRRRLNGPAKGLTKHQLALAASAIEAVGTYMDARDTSELGQLQRIEDISSMALRDDGSEVVECHDGVTGEDVRLVLDAHAWRRFLLWLAARAWAEDAGSPGADVDFPCPAGHAAREDSCQ